MSLIRLIYASVAKDGLDYSELTAILRAARTHNESVGITGMLTVGSGGFLQALEGDRASVNRLYNHIIADPRHTNCEILRYGRIVTRSFSDWSMKFVGLDDQPTAKRRALVMRHSGSDVFTPKIMSGAQAAAFLDDLARQERRSTAQV